jgi:hypothetical protein
MPGAVLGRPALAMAAALTLAAGPLVHAATVVDTGQPQCCSSIVPEMPPATNYGATMIREGDPLGSWKPHIVLPEDPPAPIEDLLRHVASAEASDGPMAAELVTPLSGLAAAYLSENRNREGIRALRRGIHLARMNNGLHAPEQVGMLEQLIAAYVRQGNFAEADQLQDYLYRVKSWQRPHGTPGMLDATLRYADWMRGAYLGDLDRERYPRLVGLSDLYEGAIDEIEVELGENSRELLPYLQGRVEVSYLISVYPGEEESGFRGGVSQAGSFDLASEAQLRFWRMQEHNFRYGLKALRRKEEILAANTDSTPRERASARIATADWYQWHRRYASAIRHYEEAWAMVEGTEGGEDWLQNALHEPLELPRDTIFNPGVMPLGTLNEDRVSLRFDVSRHGEAKKITILSEETKETQPGITRAYHYLRNLRFRPRLSEGAVVRAENVERNYQIRY